MPETSAGNPIPLNKKTGICCLILKAFSVVWRPRSKIVDYKHPLCRKRHKNLSSLKKKNLTKQIAPT